jgi:colanic acid biosynthesis protein WcaH
MLTPEQFLQVVESAPLVSIDLILRDESGAVLLGRRVNRPAQGFWFVPGGRIWKGEKIMDAMKRIASREIGHTLDEPKLMGAYDHFYDDNYLKVPGINTHYVVLAYEGSWPNGREAVGDDQHSEMRWWSVKELLAAADVHENTKRYFQ